MTTLDISARPDPAPLPSLWRCPSCGQTLCVVPEKKGVAFMWGGKKHRRCPNRACRQRKLARSWSEAA